MTLRIVHLEDSRLDAELVADALAGVAEPYRLVHVTSRQAFEQAMDEGTVDLVLSDYAIPGFDGSAALDVVRRRRPGVPFIFVSGTMGEEAAIESLRAGATDYVLKERLSRLATCVQRAIDEARERRQRLAAEERLRQQAAVFALVTRATTDAIWDWDLHTSRLTWWGDNLTITFGYEPSAATETPRFWLDRLHDEDREATMASLQRALDGEAQSWSGEYRFRRADGTYANVLHRAYVMRDADGRAVRVVGALTDLTERLSLEAQLRQAQKMEAVGTLAGGIAHDFNNILTSILGYSELVLTTEPESFRSRAELEQIRLAGNRAAGLTRQLLAFSRRQVLQPTVLDLSVVTAEIERMLRRIIGEDVELVVASDPALSHVRADRGQIEQVILNLVVNSRDAMPHGGTLTIETRNVTLTDDYQRHHPYATIGPHVSLIVSDTGEGMTAATRARIFEPFFTTKAPGEGTGLGLAMVYGIVKQSGGHIEVYSELRRGTTFKIYLPAVDAPNAAAPAPDAPRATEGSELVLLVEDDVAVRLLARRSLERAGYHVLEAGSGRDALAHATDAGDRIRLLITDAILPDTTGPEIARTIQAANPDVRVLFISGYTDDAIVRHGLLTPGQRFLQKPFGLSTFLLKVRETLDER